MQNNNKNSFTILEILVVTTLIALVAGGLGYRQFRQSQNRLVVAKASELWLTLRYAGDLAVQSHNEVIFNFDSQQNKYWLSYHKDDQEIVVDNSFSRPLILAEGLKLDSDKQTIKFYGDGSADAACLVLGNGLKFCTLMVNAATGRVKLYNELIENKINSIDLELELWKSSSAKVLR